MSVYNCHKQQPQPWMSYISRDMITFPGKCCPSLVTNTLRLLPFQIISNGVYVRAEISPYGEDTWTEITLTINTVYTDGFFIHSYHGQALASALSCGAYDFRVVAGETWWFEPIMVEDFEIVTNSYTIRNLLPLPLKFGEQPIDGIPIIAPCDSILPFMFATDALTTGTVVVNLVDKDGGSTALTITVEVVTISGKTYYIHEGTCLYPFIACGRYRLEIVDGVTYYSVWMNIECSLEDIPDGYRVLRDFNRCVMRDELGEIIYEECSDIPDPEPPEPEITPISFGLLYNAYVVTYNTGGASIAPTGWHIATEDEWFDLFNEIDTQNTCGFEMMKVGTTHWAAAVGTNTSGFTAVGNGWRVGTTGMFEKLLEASPMWTSSPGYGTNRYAFYTKFSGDDVDETSLIFAAGCAIRLIKDDSTDPGTVTDYDGNIYETVKIGSQVWTKSNLIVKHFNNGVAIPEVTLTATWTGTTDPAWCYYNNDPSNM